MGWNCRGWGWAAESIDAIQVVTADGEVHWCDESSNADLFWAARGSGPGFFGVVTAFRLRTRPRYRELTQTTYVYPAEAAPEVLGWLHTRAARRAAVGRAGGGRDHPAAAARGRPRRAGAGRGRGQLRRRARVAAGARHLPGRGQGPGEQDRPAGHDRRAARGAGARQPRGAPLHGRQRLPGRGDQRADPGPGARVQRAADGQVVLALVRPRASARPAAAGHGAVGADRPLLRHLRRRRGARPGRPLPVLDRRHHAPPRAVLGRLLPGRQRPHRSARPVHERRRLGPLPPGPRGPRPRTALRRLRLPRRMRPDTPSPPRTDRTTQTEHSERYQP